MFDVQITSKAMRVGTHHLCGFFTGTDLKSHEGRSLLRPVSFRVFRSFKALRATVMMCCRGPEDSTVSRRLSHFFEGASPSRDLWLGPLNLTAVLNLNYINYPVFGGGGKARFQHPLGQNKSVASDMNDPALKSVSDFRLTGNA